MPMPGGGKGGKFALWGILIAVGCFVFVAILGIIAAIFIPNFVDALAKAKSKRTMGDMRNVSTALASYVTDKGVYPDADSMDGLAAELEPTYIASVPRLDGWQHAFRYQCLERGTSDLSGVEIAGCTSFGLASAGRDGQFENENLADYEETATELGAYDRDIVVIDTAFVQRPAGR